MSSPEPPSERRQAPPWWPEGEPWKGDRDHQGRRRGGWGGGWGGSGWGPGRSGRRRFGCIFGLVFVLFIGSIVAFIIGLLATALGITGDPGDPLGAGLRIGGLVVLGIGVIGIVAGVRAVRAVTRPLDELDEATRRVEAGDYSVRVGEVRGPRSVRRLARGFDTMVARLEVDEQQRRTLLADVSHELRTPLAVVQGQLEAIIDGVHEPDEGHLAAVLEQTRVIARLVEDLRTVALSEAGTLPLHREPTDLGLVASEVADAFRPAAQQAGVDIVVNAPEAFPQGDLDPFRMREVLSNLMANALRYTPVGGRVTMTVDSDGERATVVVADTGAGIAPDVLPHVFERFVRSADSHGSGLGLAISRNLVEAHGGSISAQSMPGAGTTITVDLPLSPPSDD